MKVTYIGDVNPARNGGVWLTESEYGVFDCVEIEPLHSYQDEYDGFVGESRIYLDTLTHHDLVKIREFLGQPETMTRSDIAYGYLAYHGHHEPMRGVGDATLEEIAARMTAEYENQDPDFEFEFKLDPVSYYEVFEYALHYYSGMGDPNYAIQCTGYATESTILDLRERVQGDLDAIEQGEYYHLCEKHDETGGMYASDGPEDGFCAHPECEGEGYQYVYPQNDIMHLESVLYSLGDLERDLLLGKLTVWTKG